MNTGLIGGISARAKESFERRPFPHKKDEYWRFADLAAWGVDALFPFFMGSAERGRNADFDARADLFQKDGGAVVSFDGTVVCADVDQSKVEVIPLSSASEKYADKFEKLYAAAEGKFDLLPATRAGNGFYIRVADNAEVDLALFEGSKLSLSAYAFVLDAGAGARIRLTHEAAVYGGTFQAVRAAYMLGENSFLELASASVGAKDSRKYRRDDFYMGEGSEVRDAFAELSLSHTRHERNFELLAEGAKLDSRIFSRVDGNVTRDLRTKQMHGKSSCSSNVALKTALYDSSKLAFSGLIRVEEGARETDAYLSSRSLLMSDSAAAQASPILEICSNDVACSHGCTVSNPDEEELFYMRSRGIPLEEARRLIVAGFAESSFSHLGRESLRDFLSKRCGLL